MTEQVLITICGPSEVRALEVVRVLVDVVATKLGSILLSFFLGGQQACELVKLQLLCGFLFLPFFYFGGVEMGRVRALWKGEDPLWQIRYSLKFSV